MSDPYITTIRAHVGTLVVKIDHARDECFVYNKYLKNWMDIDSQAVADKLETLAYPSYDAAVCDAVSLQM